MYQRNSRDKWWVNLSFSKRERATENAGAFLGKGVWGGKRELEVGNCNTFRRSTLAPSPEGFSSPSNTEVQSSADVLDTFCLLGQNVSFRTMWVSCPPRSICYYKFPNQTLADPYVLPGVLTSIHVCLSVCAWATGPESDFEPQCITEIGL